MLVLESLREARFTFHYFLNFLVPESLLEFHIDGRVNRHNCRHWSEETIDDSKRKIKQACDEHISTDVCERAVRDYQRRLQKCVERGGKHIKA